MSSEALSIKTAFETLKMSVEEIAEDRQLDVVSVKASLMATSGAYRESVGSNYDGEFSDEVLKDIDEVIINTAKYAEDPNLRFKAAIYVRNDKKKRLDPVKQVGGFNLLVFNEQLGKVREMKQANLKSIEV